MKHLIWILSALFLGGFLGFLTAAVFASSQITELKLWNRRLQKERNDAMGDARKYRELMKVEQ